MDFDRIFESDEQKQVKAHFENMIDLAKADGEVSEAEYNHLAKMASRFHITQEQFEEMYNGTDSYAFMPPVSKEKRYERFVNLVRLAMVDDIIDPFEIKALERFAAGLSFAADQVDSIIEGVIGALTEEYQTEEGEAMRDDVNFKFASAWEYKGEPKDAVLHKEELVYENIELKTRSYK